MIVELLQYSAEITSLILLGVTVATTAKCTPLSIMYPTLPGEAPATNRPYFLARNGNGLIKFSHIKNTKRRK